MKIYYKNMSDYIQTTTQLSNRLINHTLIPLFQMIADFLTVLFIVVFLIVTDFYMFLTLFISTNFINVI